MKFFKTFFTLAIIALTFQVSAQDPCDCEWSDTNVVCVELEWGMDQVNVCDLQCFPEIYEGYVIVDCSILVYGCTDPLAENYDSNANADDHSCTYEGDIDCGCDYETAQLVYLQYDNGVILEVYDCQIGCIDSFEGTVIVPSPFGNSFDGACNCDGETAEIVTVQFEDGGHGQAYNCELGCYDVYLNATIVNSDPLIGCTCPLALNFDEGAIWDDYSCEYEDSGDCDCDYTTDNFVILDVEGYEEQWFIHACEIECGYIELLIGDADYVIVGDETEGSSADGELSQNNFQQAETSEVTNVSLFPNPVEEGLALIIESEDKSQGIITLTNSIGQKVMEVTEVLQGGTNQLEIDVNRLKPGIYFATIQTNRGAGISKRFIKK